MGKNKENQNNDKNIFHLPRHSSFTIMQDFAKWGRVRHKMAGNRINTTIWTTKAHAGKPNSAKGTATIR